MTTAARPASALAWFTRLSKVELQPDGFGSRVIDVVVVVGAWVVGGGGAVVVGACVVGGGGGGGAVVVGAFVVTGVGAVVTVGACVPDGLSGEGGAVVTTAGGTVVGTVAGVVVGGVGLITAGTARRTLRGFGAGVRMARRSLPYRVATLAAAVPWRTGPPTALADVVPTNTSTPTVAKNASTKPNRVRVRRSIRPSQSLCVVTAPLAASWYGELAHHGMSRSYHSL